MGPKAREFLTIDDDGVVLLCALDDPAIDPRRSTCCWPPRPRCCGGCGPARRAGVGASADQCDASRQLIRPPVLDYAVYRPLPDRGLSSRTPGCAGAIHRQFLILSRTSIGRRGLQLRLVAPPVCNASLSRCDAAAPAVCARYRPKAVELVRARLLTIRLRDGRVGAHAAERHRVRRPARPANQGSCAGEQATCRPLPPAVGIAGRIADEPRIARTDAVAAWSERREWFDFAVTGTCRRDRARSSHPTRRRSICCLRRVRASSSALAVGARSRPVGTAGPRALLSSTR